jgi:hypothetical protein
MLSQFSGATIDEIMALRGSGMGWGNVMKQYGLIGKGAKNPNKPVVPTNPLLSPPTNTTTNPVYGNGNGNGKGKGNNGKGNNGKGKGKP